MPTRFFCVSGQSPGNNSFDGGTELLDISNESCDLPVRQQIDDVVPADSHGK